MIPLLLLTCERAAKTRTTLETLGRHGYLDGEFMLLHADDASEDERVPAMAAAWGFETVARSTRRAGQQTMRRRLIEAGVETGAEWLLLWENDLETVRPFPWALFEHVRRDPAIWGLRLFGPLRERHGDGWPCSTINAATGEPMGWEPLEGAPEPAEVGHAHWSTRAFIARRDVLLRLASHRTAEDAMRADLGGLRVARCLENVVWHLGHGDAETTPGNVRS